MKNNLRKLRLEKQLKQKDLSKITGISFQMISDFENDRCGMNVKKLIILADYFNVSLDYLVGRGK